MRPDPRDPSVHSPGGPRLVDLRRVRAVAPRCAPRLRHFGLSDCGPHRSKNEDAFLTDGPLGLFIVCDGVGGRRSGEIAAAEAIDGIQEHVLAAMSRERDGASERTLDELADVVRLAMQHASREIFEMGREDDRHAGMSTTASVVLIVDDHAVIGQVGDTRVYHARGESTRQLTEDHTLRNLRAQRGIHLKNTDAHTANHRSPITRALGLRAAVEVDIFTAQLTAGDRILLCTDGLHEHLRPESVLTRLFTMDPKAATHAAIRHARQRGGRDNVTAVFVEALAPA